MFFTDVEEYEARGFTYVRANLPSVQRTYADSVMTLAAIDYKDSALNNWVDSSVVTTSQWHMAFKGVVSQLNVQGETPFTLYGKEIRAKRSFKFTDLQDTISWTSHLKSRRLVGNLPDHGAEQERQLIIFLKESLNDRNGFGIVAAQDFKDIMEAEKTLLLRASTISLERY